MPVHPVLYELARRGTLEVSEDGFKGSIIWEKNRHHDVHRIVLSGKPDNFSMDLTYIVDLRYPLAKYPRVRMYIEALQRMMGQDEFVFYIKSLGTIEGQTHYDAEAFAQFDSIDKKVTFLYIEMSKCNMFFDQVAAITRMCCRVSDKNDTDRFRKLLPTRLAEFTLCGLHVNDVVMH